MNTRRLASLFREIADELESVDELPQPIRKRRAPERAVPKFSTVPNDLQRARAKRILAAKGLTK